MTFAALFLNETTAVASSAGPGALTPTLLWNVVCFQTGVITWTMALRCALSTTLRPRKQPWTARQFATGPLLVLCLPPHLYPDACWDKWGDMILPNGHRVRGELFDDPSVQKILAAGGVLPLFIPWIKYPRTYHLPESPGASKDDRVLETSSHFRGKRVVVTEKRDGENTTIYQDYIHARSLDTDSHPSRSWVKNYAAKIGWTIPEGWRVCGENLWAKHSILYQNLSNYFEGFSVWDEKNYCLSWDDTLEWFELLDIKPVPILYDGPWFDTLVAELSPNDTSQQEGFVIRVADSFHYSQFRFCVAKWVRAGHVATTHHWRAQPLVQNFLATE